MMANPRDPVPATSPAEAERVNPDFPTIARPDPENPVIAQQAVRVGEHEKMLADEASHPEKRVDAAKARAAAAADAARVAADDAKAADLEAKRIIADRHGEEPVDFGAPSPARPMGTAQDAKDFLDSNNIRTEEQAEREEANRPRNAQNRAEADAKLKADADAKAKAEADAKARANQTAHKK